MFNKWNTPTAGNYWSDYMGLDNGAYGRTKGDGLGDTLIPHIPLDFYPFMKPINWTRPPHTPNLEDPGEVDSDGNYLVTWNSGIFAFGFILQEDITPSFDSPNTIYNGSGLVIEVKHRFDGTYFYRVKAYNDFGESGWSNIVDIIVDLLPKIPRNFKVSIYSHGNTLNLSWDLNLFDTVGYDIYSNLTGNWTRKISLDAEEFTFNHTGLIDEKPYYYRIYARDARGQASLGSQIICGIPSDSVAPEPPMGLRVDLATNDTILLMWEPNSELDLNGYNIYRRNTSTPNTWGKPVGHVSNGIEQYLDAGLGENSTYYYIITAFDEVPNKSGLSNIAYGTTLFGNQAPIVNNSIDDFEIVEDSYDNTTINIYYWFMDINNDSLNFSCFGQEHIKVTIYPENGSVLLVPEKNWNGQETLIFYASDGFLNVSDNVTITITPVNDPPGQAIIINPEPDSVVENGTGIYLKATCDDPDLPYGDKLTFNWLSNISGELGEGKRLVNNVLPPGKNLISLMVSDLAGETAYAAVEVVVLAEIEQEPNDIDTTFENTTGVDEPRPSKSSDNYLNLIIIGIIIIILIFIAILTFFAVIRKRVSNKKEGKSEKTKTPSDASTTQKQDITDSKAKSQASVATLVTQPVTTKQSLTYPPVAKPIDPEQLKNIKAPLPMAVPVQIKLTKPIAIPSLSPASELNAKSNAPPQE